MAPAASPKPKKPKTRQSPEALFKRRDTNKDGHMTLEEYIGNPDGRNVPALTKQFNQRDRNKDKRVTLEEMKEFAR